jgi:hypothetical protein
MKHLLQYVNPQGQLPDLVNTKYGKDLLIMGTAACLWEDLDRYDDRHGGERLAVNDAAAYYPQYSAHRLDHIAALEGNWLDSWSYAAKDWAAKHGGHSAYTHSHMKFAHWGGEPRYVWPLKRDGGTVGLFAVLIGLLMGFDRIILAGSPIDASPHFYHIEKEYRFYINESVRSEWLRARDAVFNGRVKSLSGWTREVLGEP